jgi:uncharacterized protein GlcG (DUF336 family)
MTTACDTEARHRQTPPCMRTARVLVATSVLLAAAAGPARALPSESVLPLALAQEAANAALHACARQGYPVSAAVVDGDGVIQVVVRADGAGPHTVDSSSRKAYTALTLRRATGELAELIQRNPTAEGLRDMNENILILGGGVPIKAGDSVIAGIGVGGAPGGELDEGCARAGVDAIRAQLH